MLQATMDLAKKHASDPSALKVIFSSLVLICKIFYSLNFQVMNLTGPVSSVVKTYFLINLFVFITLNVLFTVMAETHQFK